MPGDRQELRAVIVGEDRASDAFSRVGRSVSDMGGKMDTAAAKTAMFDESLKRVRSSAKTAEDAVHALTRADALLAVAEDMVAREAEKADRTLEAHQLRLKGRSTLFGGLFGGGFSGNLSGLFGGKGTPGSGAAGGAGALSFLPGALGQMSLPALAGTGSAGAIAAAVGAPFSGAAAGGALVGAFGSALAGLGIVAAARTKPVQDVFHRLTGAIGHDLTLISTPFQGVLISIASTFGRVLPDIMQPLSIAFQTMAPAIKTVGDTLAKSFASPAIAGAVNNIALAFTAFLKAFAPQIPGIVNAIAKGVSGLAQAFTDHPGMISTMSSILAFLLRLPGYALAAIGALARTANWIGAQFDVVRHRVAVTFDGIRHDLGRWGDDFLRDTRIIWNDVYGATIGALIRMGHDIERIFNQVVAWFGALPGRVMRAVSGLGAALWGYGKTVISDFWTGLKDIWGSVISWFKSLPGAILSAIGIHSPPKWALDAGEHILQGLFGWTDAKKHHILARFSTLGAQVGAAAAGAVGAVGPEQRYAASLLGGYGWGQNQLGPLIALWNRESNWNPNAVNPSSGAYGIPQALPSAQGHPYNLGDWAAQIQWGLAYVYARYGSPAAAWQHEVNFGWYDRGGFLPPGLSLAYNTTGRPEPVGAMTGGNTYNITVNVPPTVNPREAGRQVANLILAHTKSGGSLYPQGVTPS